VVDFRVHNKGGSSCFELYLRDRELWAPNTHAPIQPYTDQVNKVATRGQTTLEEKFHFSPTDVVVLQRWVQPILNQSNTGFSQTVRRVGSVGLRTELTNARFYYLNRWGQRVSYHSMVTGYCESCGIDQALLFSALPLLRNTVLVKHGTQ